MRKILVFLIVTLFCITFTACDATKGAAENACDTLNSKYIDLEIVETGGSNNIEGYTYIARDVNTNVMYFCTSFGGEANWCVILNSDGTPRLYEE